MEIGGNLVADRKLRRVDQDSCEDAGHPIDAESHDASGGTS